MGVCVYVCMCMFVCMFVCVFVCMFTQEVTRRWFLEQNPARSGDVTEIAWMDKGTVAFYFENYRAQYGEIMELALKTFPYLKQAAELPTTQWTRNIQLFLCIFLLCLF